MLKALCLCSLSRFIRLLIYYTVIDKVLILFCVCMCELITELWAYWNYVYISSAVFMIFSFDANSLSECLMVLMDSRSSCMHSIVPPN